MSTFGKIREELKKLCKQHPREQMTTLFDYYGLPNDTPGKDHQDPDLLERIQHIERTINDSICLPNCRFHLMVHEFEGLLFSNPEAFRLLQYPDDIVNLIQAVRNEFPTPEHINNSPQTAPSKRLEQIVVNYHKIIQGIPLAEQIGIRTMMETCAHFRTWVEWMKSLAAH